MNRRLKLLVARIGALGDVCMFAPVARALAARHEVHWLIRDTWVPAIRMAGGVPVGVPLGAGALTLDDAT